MLKTFKKTSKKLAIIFAAAAILIASLAIPAVSFGASGYSFWISTSYIELTPGGSAWINVGLDGAAGAYYASFSGAVSGYMSGDGWLDNSSQSIYVHADEVGTGYVYVQLSSASDYNAVDFTAGEIAASGRTVTVVVTQPPNETAYTGGDDYYETDPETYTEAPRAYAAFDGHEYRVADYLGDWPEPNSFSEKWITIDDVDCPAFFFDKENYPYEPETEEGETTAESKPANLRKKGIPEESFTLVVLEDMDTGEADYYNYDEATGDFKKQMYLRMGDSIWLVKDLGADFKVPNGYALADVNVANGTIKGLKYDIPALRAAGLLEAVEETKKAGDTKKTTETTETTQAPPYSDAGLLNVELLEEEMLDRVVFIPLFLDGRWQYYIYDEMYGNLQPMQMFMDVRLPEIEETTESTETTETTPETTTAASVDDITKAHALADKMNRLNKLLVILSAALGALAILFFILFLCKKGKKDEEPEAPTPEPTPEPEKEETPEEPTPEETPAEPAEPEEAPAPIEIEESEETKTLATPEELEELGDLAVEAAVIEGAEAASDFSEEDALEGLIFIETMMDEAGRDDEEVVLEGIFSEDDIEEAAATTTEAAAVIEEDEEPDRVVEPFIPEEDEERFAIGDLTEMLEDIDE